MPFIFEITGVKLSPVHKIKISWLSVMSSSSPDASSAFQSQTRQNKYQILTNEEYKYTFINA